MHENAHKVFKRYCAPHFPLQCRVLEVGPEAIPSISQQEIGGQATAWDTVDIQHLSPEQTFVSDDPYEYPIAHQAYDVVFSTQVMEHVPQPWRWIMELKRICRIGGLIITIAPTNWSYHECPVDCWRAHADGMKALYEFANLRLLSWGEDSLGEDGIYDTYGIGERIA